MNRICSWLLLLTVLTAVYLLPRFAVAESADLLISLVRHGDRSPRVPLNEKLWPMGKGELTPEGIQHSYQLGIKLRQAYFSSGFPETWRAGISRHVAKGMHRTIQSASAVLQGFYPSGKVETGLPDQTQIPPVFAYPPDSDILFSAHHICPGYVKRMDFLEASTEWQKKKQSYGERFTYWAEVANRPERIYSLIPFVDAINIRKLHNIPLPEQLTEKDQEQLTGLLDWFFKQLVQDQEMLHLLSANFIQELIMTLSNYQACKGSDCERFVLYVASDTNLLTFLSIMGDPRIHNIRYGAHLDMIINKKGSKARIQLKFNDNPLKLSGCPGECSLDEWLLQLRQKLPDNWQTLCGFGTGVQLKSSHFQYYDNDNYSAQQND